MNSSERIILKLESQRRALNESLMNTKNLVEANSIEGEIRAVRAAIRHYRRMLEHVTTVAARAEDDYTATT